MGTCDGKDIRVYVDGLPGTPLPFPDADLEDSGYVSIGGAEWDPTVGGIDEVRIVDYALSQDEVNHWMVNQPSGEEPGPGWRMDEGAGVTLFDRSRLRNDMQLASFEESSLPKWIASGAPEATLCPPASGSSFSLLQLPGFPSHGDWYVAAVEQRTGLEGFARAGHDGGESVGGTVDYVYGEASLALENRPMNCLEVTYRIRGALGGETRRRPD